jgi:hypothetical protein
MGWPGVKDRLNNNFRARSKITVFLHVLRTIIVVPLCQCATVAQWSELRRKIQYRKSLTTTDHCATWFSILAQSSDWRSRCRPFRLGTTGYFSSDLNAASVTQKTPPHCEKAVNHRPRQPDHDGSTEDAESARHGVRGAASGPAHGRKCRTARPGLSVSRWG